MLGEAPLRQAAELPAKRKAGYAASSGSASSSAPPEERSPVGDLERQGQHQGHVALHLDVPVRPRVRFRDTSAAIVDGALGARALRSVRGVVRQLVHDPLPRLHVELRVVGHLLRDPRAVWRCLRFAALWVRHFHQGIDDFAPRGLGPGRHGDEGVQLGRRHFETPVQQHVMALLVMGGLDSVVAQREGWRLRERLQPLEEEQGRLLVGRCRVASVSGLPSAP